MNLLTSVYGKDNGDKKDPKPRDEWFKEQIDKGLIRYINRKKLLNFFGTDERLLARSSEKISELKSSLIMKDEDDLVKLKEDNPTYYQMAGERANTAPEGKLQRAASMDKDGISPEEIWKATGWMRGPDHKWRFEIPDNLDKIDFTADKDGKFHSLEEIYDNTALYEAYPEIKNILVHLESINDTNSKQVKSAAGYVDEDGDIIIDKDLPVYEMKEVLVHEIQHIIQYKEGFSTGGNIYSAKEQIQDTIDKLQLDLQDIELKDPKAKAYMDKAQEIIDSVNGFDFDRAKQLNEERKELLESMPSKEREALSTIERDLNLLEDAAKQDDYAAYRRLGGEAEAFMTQESAKNRDKSMLDYNTPYGPAMINFAGKALPFHMEEPDLVALHNISLSNLKSAIQLGGFPVPSIAITKKQTPYTGFGDVTLIMNKSTVDPKKTPVFSRDAWTGVFPRIVRSAKKKRIQNFVKNILEPLQEEMPKEITSYGELYTSSQVMNANAANGEFEQMVESFLNADGSKYYFLKNIHKEPKLRKIKNGLPKDLTDHPKLLKAFEDLGDKNELQNLLDNLKRKKSFFGGSSEWANNSKKLSALKELMKKELYDTLPESMDEWDKGEVLYGIEEGLKYKKFLLDLLKRDAWHYDKIGFKELLVRRIKSNQKAFDEWKESFRNEMLGEAVIQDTGKPANLENIAEAMIGNLKNAQITLGGGYGTGNVIVSSARELNSIEKNT